MLPDFFHYINFFEIENELNLHAKVTNVKRLLIMVHLSA